jgi:hypothetical protein
MGGVADNCPSSTKNCVKTLQGECLLDTTPQMFKPSNLPQTR